MSPIVQQLVDGLAKLGLDVLPYLKYAAIAVVAFYGLVALFAVVVFVLIGYQFAKGVESLGRNR